MSERLPQVLAYVFKDKGKQLQTNIVDGIFS